MKKYILTGIFSVLVVSGLLMPAKSLAFNNESAQGQGKLINQDGSRSVFTFNVRRNGNGKVTGQATIQNPSFKSSDGQIEQIKIDVTCLKVIGNIAVLGGVTKRKNNQTDAEAVYFAVEDNGDAKGADKIFRGFYFDDDALTKGEPQICQSLEKEVLVLEPIAEGNIQVKR